MRSRLTQDPGTFVPPLESALALPPSEALEAVDLLARGHPAVPSYRGVRARLHQELMNEAAQQQQWTGALHHADEARRLGVVDPILAYRRALLCLGDNDLAAYRTSCSEMLKQFQTSRDPEVIKWIAWAVVLAPDALGEYRELVEALRRAAGRIEGAQAPAYRIYVGAALMRAGQLPQAVAEFEAVDQHLHATGTHVEFSPIYHRLLLAICHAQLGNTDEARRWLGATDRDIQVALSQESRPQDDEAAMFPWNRLLTVRLLHEEAQLLLSEKTNR